MKYLRYYPWVFQFLLFLLMSFTFSWFGIYLVTALVKSISGFEVAEIMAVNTTSTVALVRTSLVVVGCLNLLRYCLSATVFGYLTHPNPAHYLGLHKPKSVHVLLAICVMVGAIPLLEYIQELMHNFNFGEQVKAAQAQSEEMMKALLSLNTPGDFILTLVAMAIIPAAGEELFFRGLLMKFTAKATRNNMLFAICIVAIIFASAHTNPYGMLSIFIAGSLLGYIYYATSSLWCSIIAHMCFNAAQIAMAYSSTRSSVMQQFFKNEHMPIWLVAVSVVVSGISLYLLIRSRKPLQPSWLSDFSEQEIVEIDSINKENEQ